MVTTFSLKKAQNATGITYSQVVCSMGRILSPEEQKNVQIMSTQVKSLAVQVLDTDPE